MQLKLKILFCVLQSQCSSQERLHQLGLAMGGARGVHGAACVDGTAAVAAHHSSHHPHVAFASGPVAAVAGAGTPTAPEELRSFHRHFSSNESNPSLILDEDGRPRSPSMRPRSRSLR